MAVRHGYGKVVTDGLVFAYDTGDTINSYKGEPTTNLHPSAVASGHAPGSYGNVVTVTDATSEKGPGWKKVTINNRGSNFRIIQWTYFSHSANIMYCHSAEFDWGNMRGKGYYISHDGNGTGTRAFYLPGDYSTSQGNSISISTSLRDGKIAGTITHTASHNHAFFINNSTTGVSGLNDYFYYKEFQLEAKSHPTPYTAGTRSVSSSLLDLTGTNELDVTNVTYDSDAHFKLSGSHYLQLDSGDTFNFGTDDFTIEVVFNMEYNTSYNHFFNIKDQYHFALKQNRNNYPTNPNRIYVYRTSGLSSYNSIAVDATPGTTNHLICQRKGDNIEMYLNGEYKGSKSGWGSIDIQGDTYDTFIGKQSNEYSKGYQYVTKVYNRALTAGEVKQNFAVYKNRFNI